MVNAIPTLNSSGWAKTPETILLNVVENYVASDAEQSNTYEVVSLNNRITLHQKNPNSLKAHIIKDLDGLIGQYFAKNTTQVSINIQEPGIYDLTIEITATAEDGKTIAMGNVFSVDGTKITPVK